MSIINGKPAIAFQSGGHELLYTEAEDVDGLNWKPALNVDTGGDTGYYPSLAQVDGVAAVSYYDQSKEALILTRFDGGDDGLSWGTPLQVSSQFYPGYYGLDLLDIGGVWAICFANYQGGLRYVSPW
jgi:hypothetical protein